MEGLLNVLKNVHSVISRGYINFKKSPKERLTKEFLETKLEVLDKDWASFSETNSKLYESFTLENIEKKLGDIYEQTEEIYISYKSLIKSKLNQFKEITSGKCSQEMYTSQPKAGSSFVKLPKITIPIFSGNYSEWVTFHDLFTSLIHNNDTLDNVQKLQYLKSHIVGEAEQLIRHTPVSDANYNQCWTLLKNRYSNKKYLSNCILQRLFGQKRIQGESSTSLKLLIDNSCDCLSALKNLNIDVSTWDVIIIYIVSGKLDVETRKQWELSISNNTSLNDLPTFDQFKVFVENRYRALECVESKTIPVHQSNDHRRNPPVHKSRAMFAKNSPTIKCEYCSESHKLCFCKKFAKQSCLERRAFVSKNKICFNCLGSNHMVYDCKKLVTCRLCHKRHHSLLHLTEECESNGNDISAKPAIGNNSTSTNISPIVSCLSTKNVSKPRQVLLATALIKAKARNGQYQVIRALIDQGSQACFITEAMVQYLNLKKSPAKGHISGIGDHKSTAVKYIVNINIQSRLDPNFKLNLNAYVLNNITSYLPDRNIAINSLDIIDISSHCLADPKYNTPNKIDILLGADVYSSIIQDGVIKNSSGTLIAQNTTLGWILSGTVNPVISDKQKYITAMHVQMNEDNMLKKFWEIEENINLKRILTPEEKRCEELYDATTSRDVNGRYIVRLPFQEENPPCKSGHSRAIAEKRFKALEKRLEGNKDLKEKYTEVINDYLLQGHMRQVKDDDNMKEEAVYLPHHAVIRNDKSTTKVRVVFNASEKNTKGVSLNDTLMIGPTLQADLRHTVLRWRMHEIAIIADIQQMYRQVKIANHDAIFQRILWRDDPNKDIKDYELVTVTFGTASAPYQAVKTLHQVAYDEGIDYPVAAEKVLNSFYMDDLMAGCDSVDAGIEIYEQMNGLLSKGGFTLQKWNSNNKDILERIRAIENTSLKRIGQTEHANIKDNSDKELITIKLDGTIKILGLTWNRSEDTFEYAVKLPPLTTAPVTKRSIISDIARLFDPLGWLAPSVILAKVFIQKLWLAGVSWDEHLNKELINEWTTYRKELLLLTDIRIPRWLGTKKHHNLELHGFSDASKTAYSAVIYVRSINEIGDEIHVSLLTAKTRVAPVKQISIPRLELCGAVLLSKLLTESAEVLNIPKENIKAWTDSMVVLAWLNSHPSRWKTFVGNRVSEILTTLNPTQWMHVASKNNPADCASRGIPPSALIGNKLWFSGPSFLKEKIVRYERPKGLSTELEECIKVHTTTIISDGSIFERFSSLQRLVRIVAYCRRFLKSNKVPTNKNYLKGLELKEALQCCIKVTQREQFSSEYLQLQANGELQMKSSKLKSLTPYLDDKGIIRVSGRLHRSPLLENVKHPIVLPNKAHLTNLIVADAHYKTLHGGPQLMINYLRSAYWIIGCRNIVKHHVIKCVTCARQRATIRNQMMGSLPEVRCTPARPFLHSGIDYAGPINIRTTKGRGHRSYKGYICLFICMATRAIHLELVSDMSTQAFLAAFRRFVSRRGHCAQIWSDNGTTFVGASRELRELEAIQQSAAEHLELHQTAWHFIPPHAPNFGGLWEAGVKATKFHLKRVIGELTLTYEEMSTLLTQVEACLNSRPISVIDTSDPGEPLPLTPGHFLIGAPLKSVPDTDYTDSNLNYLTRWQLVQRMVQSFWKRWSQEYLTTLLQRHKWTSKVPEPKVGDVVLIKEDDLPPGRWLLGRVLQKHPGKDNITRVVTLRTNTSTIKRPTSKLCILPVGD